MGEVLKLAQLFRTADLHYLAEAAADAAGTRRELFLGGPAERVIRMPRAAGRRAARALLARLAERGPTVEQPRYAELAAAAELRTLAGMRATAATADFRPAEPAAADARRAAPVEQGEPAAAAESRSSPISKMRIHLLALPFAQTTKEYSLCGFTQVTIRFARMMKDLGHMVFLYASEENDAPCDELITVITKEEISSLLGMGPWEYQHSNIEEWSPLFQLGNARAAKAIQERKRPGDFICQIGGWAQHYVSDRNPDLFTVEYSIGYSGNYSPFRVFESSAWMHACYGRQNIEIGRHFDTVIPVFFEEQDFQFTEKPDDYFLYVGRLITNKGISVACDVATKAGVKLKIVGHGGDKANITGGHELVGTVDMKTRNELMSRAKGLISPTLYVEPFGCAQVEAQLCGTPVISTDFGGFRETVKQNVSGFRCSYMGEFVRAVKQVDSLNRKTIRDRAVRKYSTRNVKHDYERYFKRLNILHGEGWNCLD